MRFSRGRGLRHEVPLAVRVKTDSIVPQAKSAEQRSLELDQQLPGVCAEHGRPAIEHREAAVKIPYRGRDLAPDGARSVRLYGAWPICRACVRRARRFRWMARALIVRGVLAAVALAIALAAIDRTAHLPQLFALPVAWLVGSVVLARYCYGRANTPARCGPVIAAGTVVVSAHPAFAAAVGAVPASGGARRDGIT